jgi:hypothetical protein
MNENPKQLARDCMDQPLIACRWTVQNDFSINLHGTIGAAFPEYQRDIGPTDYLLSIGPNAGDFVKTKRKEEGVEVFVHAEQSRDYGVSKHLVKEKGRKKKEAVPVAHKERFFSNSSGWGKTSLTIFLSNDYSKHPD